MSCFCKYLEDPLLHKILSHLNSKVNYVNSYMYLLKECDSLPLGLNPLVTVAGRDHPFCHLAFGYPFATKYSKPNTGGFQVFFINSSKTDMTGFERSVFSRALQNGFCFHLLGFAAKHCDLKCQFCNISNTVKFRQNSGLSYCGLDGGRLWVVSIWTAYPVSWCLLSEPCQRFKWCKNFVLALGIVFTWRDSRFRLPSGSYKPVTNIAAVLEWTAYRIWTTRIICWRDTRQVICIFLFKRSRSFGPFAHCSCSMFYYCITPVTQKCLETAFFTYVF